MDLSGRHLILGMTGGIAAYKACELVRRLRDEGAAVRVVMTRAAQEFVTPTTMQALSGQPVFTDQWGVEGGRVDNAMPHIDLTRGADAIVLAPASAHFLAKTAQGLADDLLSTLVLARACPLLVAPVKARRPAARPAAAACWSRTSCSRTSSPSSSRVCCRGAVC
jgi:phosphopantothenoylcysteine decarboxylase/phosphopantothenate--cysteine ligase